MGDGYDQDELDTLLVEMTTPAQYGGTAFCGVTQESFAINGVTHYWKKGSTLKIGVDFDDLGQLRAGQVKEAIEAAVNEIRETTDGLKFDLFAPPLQSNIKCVLARLDGANGVLADCEIPSPGADPNNTQLRMRIDTGEVWRLFTQQVNGAIDFYRVWLHEFLHGVGLGHKQASISKPALIAPMYSPIVRNLQEADKEELIRRYGGKVAAPAPIPPVGSPRSVKGDIKVVIDGQLWGATGPLKLLGPAPQQIVRPIEQPEVWDAPDTDLLRDGELV